MQDIHSIGGGGRLFGGVGGSNGGDRRLRPHNHNHHHTPPAMKCPRCESPNTKFCYYNNYNLSQPRHFCKSCRRYWTKGGVLRNVPVGGGCRKTKRSKSSKSNPSGVRKSSISQNSSSDSCKITEKTTTTTINPVINSHETISPTTTTSRFVDIPDSVRFDPQFSSENNNGMFPEIGTFTSLITSQTPLGFNEISLPFRNEWLETDQQTIGGELKVQSPSGGFTHDWNNAAADQALFDLAGTVDQSFWKWNDHDHDQLNREL